MMRIFVTGGAGFIGSNYVRRVLSSVYPGYEDAGVTVFDRFTYAGDPRNLPSHHPRLRVVRGDICDSDAVRDALRGHDCVVHFAAESHVDRSLSGASEFMRTNVLGTQTLLDACLDVGVATVVHVSTDEVYGSIEDGSWSESEPLAPNSPYAASKAASDLVARSCWRSHGLDVRITRCSNNYGPYQHVEKFIPLFITRLLGGVHVPLYGDGGNSREWLHVDDHCQALQLVLSKGRAGEIYHIGGGAERTNLEVTALLLELCGVGWEAVRRVADRKGHDRRYSLDDSKIREELGYASRCSFEEQLERLVTWYRAHPDRWRGVSDQG